MTSFGRAVAAVLLGSGVVSFAASAAPAGPASLGDNTAKIAFIRSGDVYVMNIDGIALRRLTRVYPNWYLDEFAWTPDGKQIAFIRSREGASSSGPLRGEILDVGVGGTKARRVTAEGLDLEGLTWSPDGGQLAYSREVDGYTPQVFVVPNGSGCERLLTTKFPKGSASPAWSPIDRVVAFTAKWTSSAADYSIYTVRDDGASSAV